MNSFKLMLAPMELYTNPGFRELCYKKGADSTFTEMAMVAGLARHNKATLKRIEIPKPIPTYVQLIGSNEKDLKKFLKEYSPQKGFLGFNLNLGCSSPKAIKAGLGSALIKRTNKVQKLLDLIRNHDFPASVKLRLGLNNFEKEKKVYLNLIKGVDADFFVVHARSGQETVKDPADFSVYEECVKTGKVIIANGGISKKEQIKSLKHIGVKGAMIGSAAIGNPEIFEKLRL